MYAEICVDWKQHSLLKKNPRLIGCNYNSEVGCRNILWLLAANRFLERPLSNIWSCWKQINKKSIKKGLLHAGFMMNIESSWLQSSFWLCFKHHQNSSNYVNQTTCDIQSMKDYEHLSNTKFSSEVIITFITSASLFSTIRFCSAKVSLMKSTYLVEYRLKS